MSRTISFLIYAVLFMCWFNHARIFSSSGFCILNGTLICLMFFFWYSLSYAAFFSFMFSAFLPGIYRPGAVCLLNVFGLVVQFVSNVIEFPANGIKFLCRPFAFQFFQRVHCVDYHVFRVAQLFYNLADCFRTFCPCHCFPFLPGYNAPRRGGRVNFYTF